MDLDTKDKRFVKNATSLADMLSEDPLLKTHCLVAIDGRPCSGKTTLTLALAERLGAQTYFLDEFYLPPTQWPKNIQPGFPFPYFRYDEFVTGIQTLARGNPFKYFAYDFETGELAHSPTEISPSGKPILVEGVSVLNPVLLTNYHKKVYVVSDPSSERDRILSREKGRSKELWETLYLPSVDLYSKTCPWKNADILFAGRGVTSEEHAIAILKLSKASQES